MAVKKTIPVDIAWIEQTHKEVCSEWKGKLEAKFPTIFPNTTVKLNQKFKLSRYTILFKKDPLDANRTIALYKDGDGYTESMDVTDDINNKNKITKTELSYLFGEGEITIL